MRHLALCSRLIVGAAAICALVVLISPDNAVAGPTFVVNSAADPGTGGCDAFECTLREAITAANSVGGSRTISAVPGLGIITPVSTLPFINALDPITIDGPESHLRLDCGAPCGITWGLVFTTSPGVTASDITIRHVSTSRFNYDGIQICGGLENGACQADVSDVTISTVYGGHNVNAAVHILGAQVSDITVNSNSNFNSNGGSGLWIEATAGLTNVNIDGLRIPGAGSHGVRLIGGTGITGVDIQGGRYYSTGGSGLYMQGGTISDVLIDFLLVDKNALDGVHIKTMGASIFDVTLDAVGAYENGGRGIHVDASAGLSQLNVLGSAGSNNGSDGLRARAGLGLSSTTISGGDYSNNNIGVHVRSDGEMGGVIIEYALVENNTAAGVVLNQPGVGQGAGSIVQANNIRNNGAGIEVYGAANTVISRNSIYDNTRLGIDLVAPGDPASGVTPNDVGDGDTGPNGLLNFPEVNGGGGQIITGSTGCIECRVELFYADPDPTGHGEPATFLNDAVTFDNGTFAVSICGVDIPLGTPLTATVTNLDGQTSEAAMNYITSIPIEPCPSPTPTPAGQTPTPTATPTPSPTSAPPTPPAGTPTPTATPANQTPTPTPTGQPNALTQGDNDCDDDSDAVDALVSLQKNAGFQPNQQPGCPELGGAVPAGINIPLFGDIDCDDDVDAVDALQILRNIAGLPVIQDPGCPAIGDPL